MYKLTKKHLQKKIEKIRKCKRLGVFGSRSLEGSKKVEEILTEKIKNYDIIATAGEIKGVSKTARKLAKKMGKELLLCFPSQQQDGRGKYFRRTMKIIVFSDDVICVWDGKSKGTENEIDLLEKLGKNFEKWTIEEKEMFFDDLILPEIVIDEELLCLE